MKKISLDEIMKKYPTDKSSVEWGHNQCNIYEKFFDKIRHEKIKLLEAGIGGYEHADRGGGDLFGFAEYFENGQIFAFDLHKKQLPTHSRIKLQQASQDDRNALNNLFQNVGPFDIIIDDASHVQTLTIATFEILFPMLKEGGFYIIEDCHTSYWDKYGGCSDRNNTTWTHVHNYMKQINAGKYNIVYTDEKLIIIQK